MLVTAIFSLVVGAHTLVCAINYRWAIILFLFLYGAYPRFLGIGLSDEGFALTAQRATVFMLFLFFLFRACWGSKEIAEGAKVIKRYKLVFYSLASVLIARFCGNIVQGRFDVGSIAKFGAEFLITFFMVVLVVTYVKNRRGVELIIAPIILSLFVNQLLSGYEYVAGESIFSKDLDIQFQTIASDEAMIEGRFRSDVYRAMGVFDNPLELAGLICLATPMAILLAMVTNIAILKVFSIFAVAFSLPAAFFTGSRTALGVIAIMLAWYIYNAVGRGLTRAGMIFFGVACVVIAIPVVYVFAGDIIQMMLFSDNYNNSTMYRLIQYGRAFEKILESPVFGFGFARNIADIVRVKPLDSFYLRMLLEGGIVALSAILIASFRCLSFTKTVIGDNERRKTFEWFAMRDFRVIIICGMFIMLVLSLPYDRLYFYVTLGLIMAVHNMTYPAEENGPVPGGETLPNSSRSTS